MRTLECKPSRRLGLWLAGLGTLALVSLALASLPMPVRIVLGAVVLGLGGWQARALARPPSLRILADGRLQSPDDAGAWCTIEVAEDSFVSPALVVLRYRIEGGAVRTWTLLPDSLSGGDWRRLRVSLRWRPRTRSDTSSRGAD